MIYKCREENVWQCFCLPEDEWVCECDATPTPNTAFVYLHLPPSVNLQIIVGLYGWKLSSKISRQRAALNLEIKELLINKVVKQLMLNLIEVSWGTYLN